MDKLENGQICGTECVRLGHHGTGHGWLRMGHISSYNDKAYCGEGLGFGTYVSVRNSGI
ncbi:hypothetical protein BDV23DRAFT_160643 [Aspergillus alliaceus]|nr:hypothetical protein BDV23DRAFT_160643 [Aspergillus alliaceus]